MRTGKVLTELAAQKPFCRGLAFVDQGRMLATASTDGTLALWDTATWKLLEMEKRDRATDSAAPDPVTAWDEHGALVFLTSRGAAHLFSVRRGDDAGVESSPPPAPEKKPAKKARLPAATARWTTQAVPFKLGKTGADLFGGIPSGVGSDAWPVCRSCEQPMSHVLTLSAHPDRLPLRDHAALSLFICADGGCDTFEPNGGSNAALLLKTLASKPLAKPPVGSEGKTKVMRARRLIYGSGKGESKVGGKPDWIQGNETPRCSACTAKMQFVAQLSQELDPFLNFAWGTGYLFACAGEHEARFLWQS